MGQGKITRVVLDTNVVVSALLFGGTPGRLVDLWKSRTIQPLVSKAIIQEYIRVFAYPKFELTKNEIDYLLHREILPWFDVVEAAEGPRMIEADPSDNVFVWCAVSGKADAIVSGDAHLNLLKDPPIPVLSVSSFLASLA